MSKKCSFQGGGAIFKCFVAKATRESYQRIVAGSVPLRIHSNKHLGIYVSWFQRCLRVFVFLSTQHAQSKDIIWRLLAALHKDPGEPRWTTAHCFCRIRCAYPVRAIWLFSRDIYSHCLGDLLPHIEHSNLVHPSPLHLAQGLPERCDGQRRTILLRQHEALHVSV